MGFFTRLFNFFRNRANQMMDRVEKPEDQMALFISKLNSQIQDLQKSVAIALADEKKMKMQLDVLIQQSKGWEGKAELALRQGDEGLASEALARKEDIDSQVRILAQNWSVQKEATEKLRDNLKMTRGRIEEAKRKANLLLAQFRSAQTKQNMAKTLSTNYDDSPMKYMEQLNEKILQIEAETDAQLELTEGQDSIDLDQKFLLLEKGLKTDSALLKLKQKMSENVYQLSSAGESDGNDGELEDFSLEKQSVNEKNRK